MNTSTLDKGYDNQDLPLEEQVKNLENASLLLEQAIHETQNDIDLIQGSSRIEEINIKNHNNLRLAEEERDQLLENLERYTFTPLNLSRLYEIAGNIALAGTNISRLLKDEEIESNFKKGYFIIPDRLDDCIRKIEFIFSDIQLRHKVPCGEDLVKIGDFLISLGKHIEHLKIKEAQQ